MKPTQFSKAKIKKILEEKFGLQIIAEYEGNDGLIINAEQCEYLNYYAFYQTLGIHPKLDAYVEKHGWWFEWKNSYQINLWKH